MMDKMTRDSLPSDADNYEVWCERCQRRHRHFTFMREDYDRMIAEGAQKLAAEIDVQAAESVYGTKR